jgi:hypothetical protein
LHRETFTETGFMLVMEEAEEPVPQHPTQVQMGLTGHPFSLCGWRGHYLGQRKASEWSIPFLHYGIIRVIAKSHDSVYLSRNPSGIVCWQMPMEKTEASPIPAKPWKVIATFLGRALNRNSEPKPSSLDHFHGSPRWELPWAGDMFGGLGHKVQRLRL